LKHHQFFLGCGKARTDRRTANLGWANAESTEHARSCDSSLTIDGGLHRCCHRSTTMIFVVDSDLATMARIGFGDGLGDSLAASLKGGQDQKGRRGFRAAF